MLNNAVGYWLIFGGRIFGGGGGLIFGMRGALVHAGGLYTGGGPKFCSIFNDNCI
jgi:hypothetical protein